MEYTPEDAVLDSDMRDGLAQWDSDDRESLWDWTPSCCCFDTAVVAEVGPDGEGSGDFEAEVVAAEPVPDAFTGVLTSSSSDASCTRFELSSPMVLPIESESAGRRPPCDEAIDDDEDDTPARYFVSDMTAWLTVAGRAETDEMAEEME